MSESTSKNRKSGKRHLIHSGVVAVNIYSNLLRDFRISEGANFFANAEVDLLTDINTFRARPERDLGFVSVGRFKRVKQMECLLKKFRFSTDAYTDDELSDKSRKTFLDDQVRLHQPMPMKLSGYMVMQRARLIAHRILGEFPGDEVVNNVRFGKKSSIGCPLSLAYIDNKLSMFEAFTGTRETSAYFFDQVLPGDHILQRILANHDFSSLKEQLNSKHLNLIEVPKTWKSYRLITPLTLLGLFYSYGIGRIVSDRLKDCGLNISVLQQVHRGLVKGYSLSRTHATADLSAASDSLTSVLLNKVLPRPWYNAIKKTFVRQLKIGDRMYSTASVLPMGNGATFPVETLVFYCLIKAIGELTGIKGTYSVYGDDLIYPSKIHSYVTAVFPQLHLKLNLDKTFVSYPFRESCGSDFYRGQDVRPFFLRGEEEFLTPVRYEAFLYKMYNGLTARWDPLEIRGTLTWLLSELAMISNGILRVPPSFPDYSGIKVSSCTDIPLQYNLLPYRPVHIQYNSGSSWYQFDFLTETAKKRVVKTTMPYYWLALQGLDDEVVDDYGRHLQQLSGNVFTPSSTARSILTDCSYVKIAKKAALSWKKTTLKKVYYQGKRRVVKESTKLVYMVPSRKGSTVSMSSIKTESVSNWF